MLAPISLGGSLAGVNISPDGSTLVVADRSGGLNVVNLATLTSRKISISSDPSGVLAAVFTGNDTVLASGAVTSLVDLSSGTATTVMGVSGMLGASADRSMVAAVSVGVVSASVQLYRVSSGTVAASATEPWFFFEVAASRNGEQFAVPTYVGTYIFDQNLNQIGNLIGEGAGGSPIRRRL